jgi:hypothetical protein
VAEASAGRPTEAAKQGKPHMSGREGGSNCICPSRRRQLQGTASAAATATIQAAAAAAEEGAGGGCRGRRSSGGSSGATAVARWWWQPHSLSLSPLYLCGDWLGLGRVVVGPAEMGLLGLRFKAGERR